MNHVFIDTNILVRFTLQDNPQQNKKTREYIADAKQGKVKLTIITEILLEVEYVLRKTYRIPREQIARNLESLIGMEYFDVVDRDILKIALKIYKLKSLDLVDVILFLKARKANAKVLSFDRDFAKLKKLV